MGGIKIGNTVAMPQSAIIKFLVERDSARESVGYRGVGVLSFGIKLEFLEHCVVFFNAGAGGCQQIAYQRGVYACL